MTTHNDSSWKLGLIGSGVMAEVLIRGLLQEGVLPPDRLLASDRHAARVSELAAEYGIQTTTDNRTVAKSVDLLVLSVKPQTLDTVLRELKGMIPPETLVLSIVAGARMSVLRAGLGHERVVRCMPNLPCRIGKGMTVWAAPADAAAGDCARVSEVLGVMGDEIQVEDESHVDRATAVNGTGPAIVAEFVKAMLEAATYIGESRTVARKSVLSTLLGTVEMIGQSEDHVAQMIDEVTSPGGTTSRALQVLKQGRFGAVLTEAVTAAYERTVDLGDQLEARLNDEG